MKPKKHLPRGTVLLCIFYATNAFLLLFTTLIFFRYLDIVIFGKTATLSYSIFIRTVLIILPSYLAFGFYFLKKEAPALAMGFHSFFIINGITTMIHLLKGNLRLRPLLEIVLKPEYKTIRIIDFFGIPLQIYIIHILSIGIGLSIIIYLLKNRKVFTN
jgi:hypothetical protein